MLRQKNQINTELRAVCRLQSLYLSRFVLILFLILSTPLLGWTPVYPAAVLLFSPAILNYSIESRHPEHNEKYMAGAQLTETMKACRFTHSKYCAELITSRLAVILLIIWQFVKKHIAWHGIPIWIIPSLLLFIYCITGLCIYFVKKAKLHYNFMNIRIE